jgi:disulfide bond formation protein DsbB
MEQVLSSRVLPWMIAIAAATILAAVHILQAFGWAPCELCLRQRIPYWIAAPLAVAAGIAALPRLRLAPVVPRLLIAVAGIAFMVGAGLAVQHIGVEHGWWKSTCSTSGAGSVSELMNTLDKTPIVACNQIRPFLFGLSLPVYNLIVSLLLAALSLGAALRGFDGRLAA